MSDFDPIMSAVVDTMQDISPSRRQGILESTEQLHVSCFVTWLGLCMAEDRLKETTSPKDIVEAYKVHFSTAITKSIQKTCEVNGWEYDPTESHNRKVADEILNEMDS